MSDDLPPTEWTPVVPPDGEPARCPRCRASLPPDAAFCPGCGRALEVARPAMETEVLMPAVEPRARSVSRERVIEEDRPGPVVPPPSTWSAPLVVLAVLAVLLLLVVLVLALRPRGPSVPDVPTSTTTVDTTPGAPLVPPPTVRNFPTTVTTTVPTTSSPTTSSSTTTSTASTTTTSTATTTTTSTTLFP